MKRILFVDDEVKVLEGLERMLRSQRKQWDMAFASSGVEALALLEARPFDLLVTDMRMPEMDGAALLEQVKRRFPGVIRMVLSGYCELEAAMRAVPVAHQYLAKPCDSGRLRDAIERACNLSSILTNEPVRRVVGAVGSLPSPPGTCGALLEALREANISVDQVAKIIERDVGITAKVLQLVNSAFFGRLREVTTVAAAVNHIGFDVLTQLALSAEIFRTFEPRRRIAGFSFEEFQKHSREAANIARLLPAPQKVASASVVAALLHDAGKLVLAVRLPEQFEHVLERSRKERRPLHAVEEELTGTSHAEIGAYLLALWGLPGVVVEAVSRHHHPVTTNPGEQGLDVLAITHIADALAHELTDGADAARDLWNLEYVAARGLADHVPVSRKLAGQLPNGSGA